MDSKQVKNSEKRYLGVDVLDAAKSRIATIFDNFSKICVSFSGGKDSTVLLHLVLDEAKKRGRKVHVLFIDWEAQYNLTICHIRKCFEEYSEWVVPYWVSLPLLTVNACSMAEPEWVAWDKSKKHLWVREPEPGSITDYNFFPFYYYSMTFEEFVFEFFKWFSESSAGLSANFIGIRTAESINRYRSIVFSNKETFKGNRWTTKIVERAYNAYPLYDWSTFDIWAYLGKYKKSYNPVYDLMHKAGLSIHQMRVCEPYGNEQRIGLWLYHVIEPENWSRVVNRVSGVNQAALYAQESGNILGNKSITKPDGHTWESYAKFLLWSMPQSTAEHYKTKISVYLNWYKDHENLDNLYDFLPKDTGSKDMPSWRRVCKILLKGDYWCTGLCFSPQKASNYEKYRKIKDSKRKDWGYFFE